VKQKHLLSYAKNTRNDDPNNGRIPNKEIFPQLRGYFPPLAWKRKKSSQLACGLNLLRENLWRFK